MFTIHTPPVPQKQTQFVCNRGGRKKMAYDPSKQAKEAIRWQIMPYAPKELITGPVSLYLTFMLPIPKSVSKIMRRQMIEGIILPITRPDFDNLAYIVTNAMSDIIYKDDSQVVDAQIKKRYGEEPQTIVKIVQL